MFSGSGLEQSRLATKTVKWLKWSMALKRFIGTVRVVCGAGSMQLSGVRLSVCLSVCPIRPPHAAAAGLLLWARRPEDLDRLLHGRRSAAAAPQHGGKQHMRAVPSGVAGPFGHSGRWSNLPPFRLSCWKLESLFKSISQCYSPGY